MARIVGTAGSAPPARRRPPPRRTPPRAPTKPRPTPPNFPRFVPAYPTQTPKQARQGAALNALYHPQAPKRSKRSKNAAANRLISQALAHPSPRQPKVPGVFSKHPVAGMLGAEHNAIQALAALRASDPKRYAAKLKAADELAKHRGHGAGLQLGTVSLIHPGLLADVGHLPGKYVHAITHGGNPFGFIHPVAATGGALELAGRPGRAVGGGLEAAVKGKNVHHAVTRAFEGKDHRTISDVLRAAGWNPKSAKGKALLAAAGFVGDVASDPTTYVGGELVSPAEALARSLARVAARQTLKREGPRIEESLLRRGFTKTQARKVASRRSKRIARDVRHETHAQTLSDTKLSRTRGPQLSFAGRRVGGRHQARLTSLPARAVKKTARRVAPERVERAALNTRRFAAAANAQVRPAGMTAEEFARVRTIDRTRRAQEAAGARQANQRAQAIRTLTDKGEHTGFSDAIEAADFESLAKAPPLKVTKRIVRGRGQAKALASSPERLQTVAQTYRSDIDKLHAALQDNGVKIGDIGRIKPPQRITAQIDRMTTRLNEYRDEAQRLSEKARDAKTPQAKARFRNRAKNQGRKAAKAKVLLDQAQAKLDQQMALRPKAYDPRVLKTDVEAKGPIELRDTFQTAPRRAGGGTDKPKPLQAHERRVTSALDVLRNSASEEDRAYAAKFTTDPALKYQAYMTRGHRALAQARANHALFGEGRLLTPGAKHQIEPHEFIYHRDPNHPAHLTEIDPQSSDGTIVLDRLAKGTAPPGDYVALPKAMHDFVNGARSTDPHIIATGWTRFWNGWKKLALGTPTYLMRNMTGDLFNAMGAQDPARLAANWMRGQRSLSARARTARGYKWFAEEATKQTGAPTVSINGYRYTYDQVAALAEASGAINAGRLSDLADVARQTRTVRPRGTTAWGDISDRVENSARMATFIGGLKRGLTPEQSAAQVAKYHFDYGELTRFEKGLRNYAMPFYTFSARNVPLQARMLFEKPGLAASVESARQEGRKQAGLPEDFVKNLDPYEASQFPVPIKVGNKIVTVSTGAPFTDLTALTPSDPSNPLSWLSLPVVAPLKRGLQLLGPYKLVFEQLTNHSLFYNEAITPDPRSGQSDLTAVNPIIGKMADELGPQFRKAFGIQRQVDKTSNKEIWAWPRKSESAISEMLPGAFGATYRLGKTVAGPRGFSPTQEALGTLAGIRAKPLDPVQGKLRQLNDEFNRNQVRINELHGNAINLLHSPTPELRRLQARNNALQKQIDALQRGRLKFYKGRPTGGSSGGGGGIDLSSGGADLSSGGADLSSGGADLSGGGVDLR